MNHTFGYILCCQSPALFLLAIALVIRFFICKGRAKFRAVLSLIGGLVCIALGVVLYYQGLVREHFAVRDFWHIRIPGWIGLALMAALLIYLTLRAFLGFSARRSEQKEEALRFLRWLCREETATTMMLMGAKGSHPGRKCPPSGDGKG